MVDNEMGVQLLATPPTHTPRMTLPMLYQDEHLVVVHKPPGMLVHRSRVAPEERRFVMQTVRNQVGQHVFPVHRLDRPTSGALVLGLSSEAARRLTALFAEQQVEKTYLAVVRGHPPEAGVVEKPLAPLWSNTGHAQQRPDKPPQPAATAYERLATAVLPISVSRYPTSWYALVRALPKTGRTHQIRRHLNHLTHPIIGDVRHGDYRHNRFFRDHFGCRRLLLAAVELSFVHPFTDEPLHVRAPLGADFIAVLDALGWAEVAQPFGSEDQDNEGAEGSANDEDPGRSECRKQ